MLRWTDEVVACPCGATVRVKVTDTLHVSRSPELRREVLEGTFHRALCDACGRLIALEKKLLYTDFGRHHWIGVCPVAWMPLWSGVERELRAEFERVLVRSSPPFLRAVAPQFLVRLVFGYDQLAEKLVISDAGLDDRAIERVKLRVGAAHPDLLAPGRRMLLAPPAPDAARFELEVYRAGERGHARIGFDRALYDEELARGVPDDDTAFVSLERALHPRIADDDPRVAGALWPTRPGEVFR